MNRPNSDRFYQAALTRMVERGLQEKHDAFAKAHENDTKEELADYLCYWARILHHTPHPGEIWGTEMIAQRFGGWEAALLFAGLQPNPGKPRPQRFAIYIQELEYQKAHYRENRNKEKQHKQQQNLERKQQRKERKLEQQKAEFTVDYPTSETYASWIAELEEMDI